MTWGHLTCVDPFRRLMWVWPALLWQSEEGVNLGAHHIPKYKLHQNTFWQGLIILPLLKNAQICWNKDQIKFMFSFTLSLFHSLIYALSVTEGNEVHIMLVVYKATFGCSSAEVYVILIFLRNIGVATFLLWFSRNKAYLVFSSPSFIHSPW